MIKTTSLIAAVAGLALAAFATAPPANAACGGHQASAVSLNGVNGDLYVKQMTPTSPMLVIGYAQRDNASVIDKAQPVHYAINGPAQANDDPAATIDKAALTQKTASDTTGIGHGSVYGIGHTTAKNSGVNSGGGLEVAADGAKACVLSVAVLVADNQTLPANAAGAASI